MNAILNYRKIQHFANCHNKAIQFCSNVSLVLVCDFMNKNMYIFFLIVLGNGGGGGCLGRASNKPYIELYNICIF